MKLVNHFMTTELEEFFNSLTALEAIELYEWVQNSKLLKSLDSSEIGQFFLTAIARPSEHSDKTIKLNCNYWLVGSFVMASGSHEGKFVILENTKCGGIRIRYNTNKYAEAVLILYRKKLKVIELNQT